MFPVNAPEVVATKTELFPLFPTVLPEAAAPAPTVTNS
jgi:hypothetical protein